MRFAAVVTVGFSDSCDFVCDGTDDDVEILAAIDSLPENGGTVKLAAGDYYLSSTIASAKNNVRIVGEVNSTTTLVSSKPAVNLHGGKVLFNPSGWNWQFSQVSFLGEEVTATSASGYGLNLQNAKGSVRVERCFFSGWYAAVYAAGYGDAKDTAIHGCAVMDCTYGIRNPKNAAVIGCVISGVDFGIYAPVGCGIHGNVIRDCAIGIGPIDTGKNTITGNTVTRGSGTAADYTDKQHTILLGQLDLDNTTVLYGNHNCITGNFLRGKDVTIAETTQEAALAELETCIISDNLAGSGGAAEVPYFDLAAMGLPAVSIDSSANVDAGDLTEVFAAMERGAIRVSFLANVGVEVTVESMINPTQIVGGGQCGSTVLLFMDGTLVAVEVTFNSNGVIYVGAKTVTSA